MATGFDPLLPADGAPVVAIELRNQMTALDDRITNSAVNPSAVATLGLTISNPPTQAEVQAVADKLDEIITALIRP